MNATVIEQQNTINDLNSTKLGKPDYDSGWAGINKGTYMILNHDLGTTNVLVYMIGKYNDTVSPYIHQHDYGGELNYALTYGAFWYDLTNTTVSVKRGDEDTNWNYVRVVIWKIPT